MVTYVKHDLEFILNQILISEAHAAASGAGTSSAVSLEESREILLDLLPNSTLPWGLRTVDGTLNNLIPGQENYGAANNPFPTLATPSYTTVFVDPDGDGPSGPVPVTYQPGADNDGPGPAGPGDVFDPNPRIISNLIVDMTANNPAAVAAAGDRDGSVPFDHDNDPTTPDLFFIPNEAPDEGLSAPFNSWMTLFGQFFDHGLDLVNKGGSGTVFIPLMPDDPLYVEGGPTNFMVLTRVTVAPGADGVFGTSDDILPTNDTTSFIDQNQTYASHPSHQVLLREYAFDAAGDPVATGKLITNRDLGADGEFGGVGANADTDLGGMATWGIMKAQARDLLGIELDDLDALDLPLLATDQYGNFIPGPNGFPQIVTATGLIEGNPNAPIDASLAIRSGHAALADIAHTADPTGKTADTDSAIGLSEAGAYDNELLDEHFVAGDGRANENIGLTAVHHVFHAEHNRLVEHTKAVLFGLDDLSDASQDTNLALTPVALLNAYLDDPLTQAEFDAILADAASVDRNDTDAVNAFVDGLGLDWNGERLFQAAKFGTEMQYQHLVFEEFGRKVQPLINIFGPYDTTIDASIVAEFAHTVYRFGHSMLTETVDRFDTEFNVIGSEVASDEQIGLIEAFLNPLEFDHQDALTADEAAGAVVRGMTRQVGNEIDEFVTDALRNNLLGLPLDLATINLARGRDTGVPSLNEARRDFYEGTGDIKLKPYESWVDFAMHAKHPLSMINFIAAYGTHEMITGEETLAGKRAAAWAIVTGQTVGVNGLDGIAGTADDLPAPIAPPADRLDFLNSTGAWASDPNGVTNTGLDDVDLWIGGLAEAIEPFGGMLGSTFAFVFEEQMEKLQDGDRFYYLNRTIGLNFLNQLEQNSFADLISRHTDATHLPGDVFATPAFILEVDQTRQFNDGLGSADPVDTSNPFFGLVIRDNPATAGADSNFLQYTGGDHVVLGGTSGNDTLISGIGDDTLWGDAGNDRLESGPGADIVLGGDGDDIITDSGGPGPDNLQGQNGNDVIAAGPGEALILAGAGKDYVLAGRDLKETFGGLGDDFINGGDDANVVFGNEGHDWIEGNEGNDLLQGDNGDRFLTSTIIGHDVIIGDGGDDDYDAESGDDIMITGAGVERNEGGLGFDWVSYKNDPLGVEVDMTLRAFDERPLPPSSEAIMDRFDAVEGLSGSAFADILRADSRDPTEFDNGPAPGVDHVLRNFDLIDGLRGATANAPATSDALFGSNVTEWSGGEILLGGDGSDLIEGRGGNDLIDGDLWLNVRIGIHATQDVNSPELATVDSMQDVITAGPAEWVGRSLSSLMLDGTINPGQLHIVREILNDNNGIDFDTALFSGLRAEYTIETLANGTFGDGNGDGYITVTHNDAVLGVGQGADGVDNVRNIERLRFSDQSIVLGGLNAEPVGRPTISDTTPAVGQTLTASIAGVTDADNLHPPGDTDASINAPFVIFWQVEEDPGTGVFTDILITDPISDEELAVTGTSFTVTEDLEGLALRVRLMYQDDNGVIEEALSLATSLIAPPPGPIAPIVGTPGPDELIGGAGDDIIDGLGGNDTIEGGAGDDQIDGGAGADDIDGGDGNDVILGGDGVDAILGGAGADDIDGGAGADEIEGGAGQDTIAGGAGADEIDGGGGQDILTGGAGADTIAGGAGADEIDGGVGADELLGDAGNDVILGGAGADEIDGGAGNDEITGDAGADTLTGGAGNDMFLFGAGFGNDTITDFGDAAGDQDEIDFTAFNIAGFDFNDLTIVQNGADTVITSNAAGFASITLEGVTAGTIQADDFNF